MKNDLAFNQTVQQKYLGKRQLIVFIALLNMAIPISIDMYLPALPKMSSYFNVTESLTNLTLSGFMLFYALGILLWGPISQKYGRKKVLIVGLILYILSSLFCAVAINISILIFSRICQGIGAGAITTVSMAIVKDSFSGKEREKILAIIQTISGLAPMLAPILGAFLLKITNWRGTFVTLAIIGGICMVLAMLFTETLHEDEKYRGSILGSLGRLGVVAKNWTFTGMVLIFSLSSLAFMGYLAISSFIYQNYFGLSERAYSYFFAANAIVSITGPFIYVKVISKWERRKLVYIQFLGTALSGIAIFTIGGMNPWFFWFAFAINTFITSVMRPFSTNLMLDQAKGDSGASISVMSTVTTIAGSIGMQIASIHWNNVVKGLGGLVLVAALMGLIAWNVFVNSKVNISGLDEA